MESLPAKAADDLNPPYIPWKSFEGFVGVLKSSHPPDTIDGTVMPTTMAGGLQRQVRSALKFLRLTEPNGKVTPQLNDLIKAHGTPQWPVAVKELIVPAYDGVIGNLPIDKATSGQVDAKFKDKGLNGQVLEKAVRFYLHALKIAGVKYSSYLSIRKSSSPAGKPKRRKPEPNVSVESGEAATNVSNPAAPNTANRPGTVEFPLHFGDKETGKIVVPERMTADDLDIFDAMVAAVKAFATRKKGASG